MSFEEVLACGYVSFAVPHVASRKLLDLHRLAVSTEASPAEGAAGALGGSPTLVMSAV